MPAFENSTLQQYARKETVLFTTLFLLLQLLQLLLFKFSSNWLKFCSKRGFIGTRHVICCCEIGRCFLIATTAILWDRMRSHEIAQPLRERSERTRSHIAWPLRDCHCRSSRSSLETTLCVFFLPYTTYLLLRTGLPSTYNTYYVPTYLLARRYWKHR